MPATKSPFKVGDKAEVIHQPIYPTKHETENRSLRVGDVVTVVHSDEWKIAYEVKEHRFYLDLDDVRPYVEQKVDTQGKSHPCNCDMMTVINTGCKCGGY